MTLFPHSFQRPFIRMDKYATGIAVHNGNFPFTQGKQSFADADYRRYSHGPRKNRRMGIPRPAAGDNRQHAPALEADHLAWQKTVRGDHPLAARFAKLLFLKAAQLADQAVAEINNIGAALSEVSIIHPPKDTGKAMSRLLNGIFGGIAILQNQFCNRIDKIRILKNHPLRVKNHRLIAADLPGGPLTQFAEHPNGGSPCMFKPLVFSCAIQCLARFFRFRGIVKKMDLAGHNAVGRTDPG